jgi:elongation factor P--beta-lysine ligase
MLSKIIQSVKSWFTSRGYESELEQYIVSHNPQNNAHVEALEREFESIRAGRTSSNFVWGRGF